MAKLEPGPGEAPPTKEEEAERERFIREELEPARERDRDGDREREPAPEYYTDPSTGERVTQKVYEAGQKLLREAREREEAERPQLLVEPEYPADAKPDKPGGQQLTIKGEAFYIPGSTMYEMGFRTPEEYRKAQQAGTAYGPHEGKEVPEGSVVVKTAPYGTLRWSPGERGPAATQVRKGEYWISHEGKLLTFTEAKLVQREAKLAREAYLKWVYEEAPAVEAQILAHEAYLERLVRFEAELKDLPQPFQDAYRKGGVAAYNKLVEAYNVRLAKEQEEQQKYTDWIAAIRDLAPYKILPTPEQFAKGKIPEVYNVIGALEDARTNPSIKAALNNLLGFERVREIGEAMNVLSKWRTEEGYNLSEVPLDKPKVREAVGTLFGYTTVYRLEHPVLPAPKKPEFAVPVIAERTWMSVRTGEVITQTELKERYPKGYEAELDEWVLTGESAVQLARDVGRAIKGVAMRIPQDVQMVVTMRQRRTEDPEGLWDYRNPKTGQIEVITTTQFNKLVEEFEAARMSRLVVGALPEPHPFDLTAVHMTPEEKRALLEVGVAVVSIPLAIAAPPALAFAVPTALRIPAAVVRFATRIAIHAIKLAPAAYTTAALTEGAKTHDLERKWEVFQALPLEQRDYWAKQLGYKDFEGLNDLQKSEVLLRYAVPASVTLTEWQGTIHKGLEASEARTQELIEMYREKLPIAAAETAAVLTWLAEGALVELPGYAVMLPTIVAQVIDQVPEDNAVPYALATLLAFGAFFASIPKDIQKDPVRLFRYVGLFLGPKGTVRGIVKSLKAIKDSADMRMVPRTALALQADIARVARPEEMTFEQARTLLEGAEYSSILKKETYRGLDALKAASLDALYLGHRVKVKDASGKALTYFGPTQIVAPQVALHGTPNVADFKIGKEGYMTPKTGELLFVSPQMPQSFMAGTALTPPKNPGGVAIRFSAKDLKDLPPSVLRQPTMEAMRQEMYALARTGRLKPGLYPLFKEYGVPPKLEFEMVIAPNTKLYSIDPTRYAPSTFKTEVLTTKTTTHPIKVAKIDVTTIKEVKGILTGDKFDKAGNIIEQAKPYTHPAVGGRVRRRVTAVVVDKSGTTPRILLVTDRMEPQGYYGLPGGNLRIEHLMPGAEKFRVEDAAWLQVQSEVGFGLKNMEALPSYLGRMNRHSLPGSYVRMAEPDSLKIDVGWFKRENPDVVPSWERPETREGIWWDGKRPVEVSPGTFDIITKLAAEGKLPGLDISKMRISGRTPPELLTARDTAYYQPPDLSVGGVTELTRSVTTVKTPTLVDYGTAVSETRSWLSQPEMGGYEIKVGQRIPLVWLRTKAARNEGLGALTGIQTIKAKLLTPILSARNALFLAQFKRRKAEAGEPAVQATTGYASVQLKVFKRDVTEAIKEAKLDVSKERLAELDRARSAVAIEAALDRIQKELVEKVERDIAARVKRGEPRAKAEFEVVWALTGKLEKVLEFQRRTRRYIEELLPYRDPSKPYRMPLALRPEEEPEIVPTEVRPEVVELRREALLIAPREPIFEIPPTERVPEPVIVEPRLEVPPEVPPEPVPEAPVEPVPEPPVEPVPEPPLEPPIEPPIEVPPEVPYEPPYPPTPVPPSPPVIVAILGPKGTEPKKRKLPSGSIAWRQGALKGGDVIKYIPPPYTQLKPRTLIGERPIGWVDKGTTPQETIQIIGEAKDVPKRLAIDLGWTDIFVVNGKRISFSGAEGLLTDVGTRLPSKTRGMSIPGGGRVRRVKKTVPKRTRPSITQIIVGR